MELGGETVRAETIDHHGLIAATCKDLKIAEKIDGLLYANDTERVVTPGESVVAMILNGLGFTNRRLYLMPQFFKNKPIEKLIAPGLKSEDITYDTLTNTLDDICQYGESELYGRVALDIALENNLLGTLNHLDTTSISVEGRYNGDEEPEVIKITHGHSKDHRPDLKQIMLSLTVTGDSAFPLWMETLDGNSSDKVNFHETISRVKEFQSQLNFDSKSKWVADSALYTKGKLLTSTDYLWLTRVPETIKEAKLLVSKNANDITWTDRGNGYKTSNFESNCGGMKQRWLLVYSEQGYQREIKTLGKRIDKQEKKFAEELKKIEVKIFGCEKDAKKAIVDLQKGKRHFILTYSVEPVEKHKGKGRPKAGAEKEIVGYRVKGSVERDKLSIELETNKKGRFILATNDLDRDFYPDDCMLTDYKNQQKAEGGFRFLKDPWFMLDSVFLKKPERISALMMVMTLCLMVYNVTEYKMREALKSKEETLPNQKGKGVSNPTLRWVFQLMEGINIVRLFDLDKDTPTREIIANLDPVRLKIIHLFGRTACEIYGLIDSKPAYPLRR